MLALLDFEREEHFEQVGHLDTLIKSIILSAGGEILVSKEFVEMVVNGSYQVQNTETDEALKFELIPVEDGDEDDDEDEFCPDCGGVCNSEDCE